MMGLLLLIPGLGLSAEFPELQWLHPATDRLEHLTRSPAECLDLSGSPEQVFLIEVGRQAFRSPALLGGQASRVGLSCQGCHINGHDHPDFYIESISGQAGTVDVTSAVFSELRGDGLHNPVSIPKLLNISKKQSFGTVAPMDSLANFVEALIVEEFAGEKPSPLLLNALVKYLEALSTSACPSSLTRPNNLDAQLLNITRSLNVIDGAYNNQESTLADFLIMSTQYELSIVYQRFAIDDTDNARQQIIKMSRKLGGLRNQLSGAGKGNFIVDLEKWKLDWGQLTLELQAIEHNSLYQTEVLEKWLSN